METLLLLVLGVAVQSEQKQVVGVLQEYTVQEVHCALCKKCTVRVGKGLYVNFTDFGLKLYWNLGRGILNSNTYIKIDTYQR